MIALATNFRNATLSVDWPALSSELARVSARLHVDDVPRCPRPPHEGVVRKGHKLTVAEIDAIRVLRAQGEKLIYIAALFGIDVSTVGRVCSFR